MFVSMASFTLFLFVLFPVVSILLTFRVGIILKCCGDVKVKDVVR